MYSGNRLQKDESNYLSNDDQDILNSSLLKLPDEYIHLYDNADTNRTLDSFDKQEQEKSKFIVDG